MKPFIQSIFNSLIIMVISFSAYAAQPEPEPATVWFDSQGFNVEAPAGASMLEVRLMGPARTLLFEARSTGEPINWQLNGNEVDGEYRYEAVVVMDIDGVPRQRNLPGGFEVEKGVVVPPPVPVNADELITNDLAD